MHDRTPPQTIQVGVHFRSTAGLCCGTDSSAAEARVRCKTSFVRAGAWVGVRVTRGSGAWEVDYRVSDQAGEPSGIFHALDRSRRALHSRGCRFPHANKFSGPGRRGGGPPTEQQYEHRTTLSLGC